VAASTGVSSEHASGGGAPEPELLKIGELAERAGVSPGTVRHYLREGLLLAPVKTSRNMAWYPAENVERIALIRRLQEERFMPLRVIREVLEDDPERIQALIELDERIHELLLAELARQRGR
jgi:DNA-binding transcriptional MerR regulator